MVTLSYDHAAILCMRHIFKDFTDEDISKFLQLDLGYVKKLGRQAELQLSKVVYTLLNNRRNYEKREIIAGLIRAKGGGNPYDLEKLGITREALLEEATILGLSEEDEYYQERFGSSGRDPHDVDCEADLTGQSSEIGRAGEIGDQGIFATCGADISESK